MSRVSFASLALALSTVGSVGCDSAETPAAPPAATEDEPAATEDEPAATPKAAEAKPTADTARKPQPVRYGEHFAFVIRVPEPYIVLSTEPQEAWNGGPLELQHYGLVSRDVAHDALPASLAAWEGREFRLYGHFEGELSEGGVATVGKPVLLAEAIDVPFATDDLRSLQVPDHKLPKLKKLSRKQRSRVAEALWKHGRQILVAPLEGSDLDEGTWAVAADRPKPVILGWDRTGEAVGDTHLAYYRAQSGGAEAFEAYEEGGYGDLTTTLRTITWAQGDVSIAGTFIHSSDAGSCGGFDTLFAVAEVRTPQGSSMYPLSGYDRGPDAVVDLNADGFPELMFDTEGGAYTRSVVSVADDGLTVVERLVSTPAFGCAC